MRGFEGWAGVRGGMGEGEGKGVLFFLLVNWLMDVKYRPRPRSRFIRMIECERPFVKLEGVQYVR